MTKVFHDDEGGADSRDLIAVIHHNPDIQEMIEDGADVEELAQVLLPKIGVDPAHWPDWSDAIREAALTWKENKRLADERNE